MAQYMRIIIRCYQVPGGLQISSCTGSSAAELLLSYILLSSQHFCKVSVLAIRGGGQRPVWYHRVFYTDRCINISRLNIRYPLFSPLSRLCDLRLSYFMLTYLLGCLDYYSRSRTRFRHSHIITSFPRATST